MNNAIYLTPAWSQKSACCDFSQVGREVTCNFSQVGSEARSEVRSEVRSESVVDVVKLVSRSVVKRSAFPIGKHYFTTLLTPYGLEARKRDTGRKVQMRLGLLPLFCELRKERALRFPARATRVRVHVENRQRAQDSPLARARRPFSLPLKRPRRIANPSSCQEKQAVKGFLCKPCVIGRCRPRPLFWLLVGGMRAP